MKALIVGSGGVGESIAQIAHRRDPKGGWLEKLVLADYDLGKAQAAAARLKDDRFVAEQVDASDVAAVAALAKKHGVDILCNLCAPEFNPQLLQAALAAQVHYLDTAMTVSEPHPEGKIGPTHVKLGDHEFPLSSEFEKIGKLALAGFGVEPGMADYFARYAADHFFDEIEEIGIRDGSNLEIPGAKGISFGFSIWTTIEECTQPAIVWEKDRGWYTVEPFAELERFFLPEGIGTVEIAHVEHEEVISLGRSAHLLKGNKKATFKYALGDEFMEAIEIFKSTNMDKKTPIKVKGVEVAPRDVIAAAAPDPNEIGKKYVGQTAAGTWVRGKKDGMVREAYLYQIADNQECVQKYGTQVVVAQTGFTPAVTMELLATGKLQGYKGNPEAGVHVPEEFSADDYVALMPEYEFPGGLYEMDSEYKRHMDHKGLTAPLGK
jgi:saccharopine dehydrogenase-like NADP-dependent oxidoreductase